MAEHPIDILLRAKDQASKQIAGVNRELTKTSSISAHANKGVRSFKSNLKGAFTTPLGLLGITGGLFSLEHIFTDTIGKAQAFGGEMNRLAKLSGLSTDVTAGMSLAFSHYGIEADKAIKVTAMLEKNVGNLTASKKKAKAFEKLYGLSLVDSNGKVKDANQLLLDSADFFNNKSIPATTKAAALAKLYGRSWADLIPLLSAGKAGLAGIEEEAKKDGLGSLAKAAAENKTAMRDWNTQLDLLEITIGAKLLPKITDLAKTATAFIGQHSDEIVGFFEDASKFASDMGGAIHDYVIPAFSMIGDAWSKVPPELKKVLIAGFAVNKLTGGALGDIVSELGKGLIKGVLGITAGVVNVNGGIVNGGGAINPVQTAETVAEDTGKKVGLAELARRALKNLVPSGGATVALGPEDRAQLEQNAQNFLKGVREQGAIIKQNGVDDRSLIDKFLNKPVTPIGRGTGSLTGGAPGRGGPAQGLGAPTTGSQMGGWAANRQAWTDTGKKIGDLEHNAVTAIDGSKAAVVQSQDATKNAVTVGSQGIARNTLQGASTVTTQSIGNASRIVGAIAANRAIVSTKVIVNVSGSTVTSSQTTQSRTGSSGGSSSNDSWNANGKD